MAAGRKPLYEIIRSRTPLLLFLMIAASIFLVESAIMLLLPSSRQTPVWVLALTDAVSLVLLLFPVLYFFMFRPMRLHIDGLFQAHQTLESEIAEKTKAEATLKESEKRLQALSAELLRAQEKERRRVSRELHEELGVTLAALKLSLRFVARGLQPGQADLKEECEQNLRNLDTLIENIRRLSRELSPSSLEDIGLSAALGRLVAGIARDRRLQFSLDVADVDHLFPAEAQINVFRVFQEALSNIEKHSEATHISLVVGRRDGGVSFTLEDDGKGFDLHGIDRKVGLTTMFERGRMLGGTLDVVRTDKGGTRITLTIPIPD